MDKYLPIKFYQRREDVDDRFTPAVGGDEQPKWVLEGEELSSRSSMLIQAVGSLSTLFQNRKKEYDYVPIVASVSIEDSAIAKSHRSAITELFGDERKHSRVIGYGGENELFVRIDSAVEANLVQTKLGNKVKYAKGISAITGITTYEPIICDYDESFVKTSLKASLFNYYDYGLNNSVKQAFTDLCDSLNIGVREAIYNDDLIVYRLSDIESVEQYNLLRQFPAIQYIEPMPMIKIGASLISAPSNIDIMSPDENTDYPVVGILDGGVSEIEHLSPWIIGHSGPYPEEYLDKNHGTFIGGVIAYGDKLEKREITGVNGIKIYDAVVMPDTNKETLEEDDFIENIREAVRTNPDIKIWNLSIGYDVLEVQDSSFSDLAVALDGIQEEFGVIFCKASGNCHNFETGRPVGRVTIPAESLLSITVGSVSNDDTPSCFSRIGPGSANTIKPELVSYGGGYVKHNGRLLLDGVKSFSPDGQVYESAGTSYSTPRIAALLSSLQNEIREEYNPLLIKALAIHSANYPKDIKLEQEERVRYMGYGIPAPIKDILFNSDHEITMIQSDRLMKGKFMEILEFPYPECLIDSEGYYYGDVTITLVTQPKLIASQGAEYCQSDIDVKFGTFDEIENKITTSRQRNEYGPEGFSNILLPAMFHTYASSNKDIDNPFMRERTLLNYGKKYQPIKKWHINLSEITPANKDKYLKAPKKWCLRLSGLFRDFSITRAALGDRTLYQDFSLVITIKDPNGEKQVYNEVTQLLNNRNFIHNDIKLRDNVRERISI